MPLVVRPDGALEEVLVIGAKTATTVRGKPFAVKAENVVRLCLDGTGRFKPADPEAEELVAAEQARRDAEAQAAAAKAKAAAPEGEAAPEPDEEEL